MSTNLFINKLTLVINFFKDLIIDQPLTPRLQNEHRQLLLQRASIGAYIGGIVYLFTILLYDYLYFPERMDSAILASLPPAIAAFMLPLTLRTRVMQKYYNLPLFLILAIFSNYAQVMNYHITGGTAGFFFFPYFVIFFGMAVYYPGSIYWILSTATLLIIGYVGSELIMGRRLLEPTITSNIIYLFDMAFIGVFGSRLFYKFFIRDKKNQIKLEENNKKLKSLDKAKTRFFSNVTHEFRTPLVALASAIQMILDQTLKDPKLQKELLISSQDSLEEMLDNVNDLLIKSRSDKGLIEVEWSKLEIGIFMERSLSMFKILAKEKNNRLLFSNQLKAPLELYADRPKLKKIFNNLVGNALKFTENGVVQVTLSQSQDYCVLQVKDTGRGIPQEELKSVFDPFTQASNNPLREAEGTGLGLSMVKDFVELLQGTVSVESKVDQGSCFTVGLRLGDEHVDKNKITISEYTAEEGQRINAKVHSFDDLNLNLFQNHDPSKQDVLLVEDNPQIIQILGYVLAEEYNVHFAKDGQEGLEKAKQIAPDLILSDIMMPEKNGYELLAALKGDTELKKIPVILLTSKSDLPSRIQGLQAGADEYLSKPFNNIEIQTRVRNILDRKKLEAELIHAEKMIALGNIVSGIAHEILNPISYAKRAAANIVPLIEATKQGILSETKGKERLQISLSNVEEGIDRVCEITNALKGFIKKGDQNFQKHDLHDGIESTLKIFNAQYGSKVYIHREYHLKEKVSCKLSQLNQVFLNLMVNAAQAMKGPGNLWIKTLQDDELAMVQIKDDGPGIPKTIQTRIFEPFFTQKIVGESTGLGLYISRQIVQSHSGTLTVASHPGQGTQFTLKLPLEQQTGGNNHERTLYDGIDRRVAQLQYPYRG